MNVHHSGGQNEGVSVADITENRQFRRLLITDTIG